MYPDNEPCQCIIDDILVFSRTVPEHLKKVLDHLIKVGLKLKPAKCQFIHREVYFLGHAITLQVKRHITAITQFPVPKSVTEVWQFMGLSSYYCHFVKKFAQRAQPLHALTRKGATYVGSESCQEPFQELTRQLTEAPILAYFTLKTDAII